MNARLFSLLLLLCLIASLYATFRVGLDLGFSDGPRG